MTRPVGRHAQLVLKQTVYETASTAITPAVLSDVASSQKPVSRNKFSFSAPNLK